MTEDVWEKILTLLGVMILADSRVCGTEVDAFVEGVRILRDNFEPDDASLECAIREWYNIQESRLRALSQSESFEIAIAPLLADLSELPNRQLLLDQLGMIADSDSHRDAKESDLLILAAAFWDLVRTSSAA